LKIQTHEVDDKLLLQVGVAPGCAAGRYPSSKARLVLGVLGRTKNLQTARGSARADFFQKRRL